jgi:hypothetical protein
MQDTAISEHSKDDLGINNVLLIIIDTFENLLVVTTSTIGQ